LDKVLIINFCGLGDKIYTTPVFREIKKNMSDSKITFLTQPIYAEIFSNNPYIDRLILLDKYKLNLREQLRFYLNLRAEKFDITIDLTKSARGRMITLLSGAKKRVGFKHKGLERLAYNIWTQRDDTKTIQENSKYVSEFFLDTLRILQMKVESSDLELYPSAKDRDFARKFLNQLNEDNKTSIIGLNPGVSLKIKQWKAEKFAQLANILQQNYKIILIQGPLDKEIVTSIVAQMKNKPVVAEGLTLMQLASLISHFSLLITTDSGVKPIAVAMDVPTITLFGPTNYINYTPTSGTHLVVRKGLPCSPCGRLECKDPKCMELIEVEEVLDALKQIKI